MRVSRYFDGAINVIPNTYQEFEIPALIYLSCEKQVAGHEAVLLCQEDPSNCYRNLNSLIS